MKSLTTPTPSLTSVDPLRHLKLAVYAYFILWIFEGSLRKWIVPGLSGPLLIIRDPVLIYIYFEAFRQKVFKINGYVAFLTILSLLSTIVSFGLSHPPSWKIIAFGYRANFLHLPLIFLLPAIFDSSHVKRIGRLILWLAPPMAMLAALQFLSPSGARINAGAGVGGGMIETALGRIRPSGTFSFTNGLAEYSVLLTAFLFHHLLEKNVFSKLAVLCAAPSLLILVVMSGSRTVFALVGLQVLTVLAIWIIKPRFMRSSLKLVLIGLAVIGLVGSIGALRDGMDVITARFVTSGGLKEGFVDRVLEEFKKPFEAAVRADAGGVGIGMGTNAASSLMYNMLRFNFGESEMDRIIMEMGPYLGFPYLAWRFAALFLIIHLAYRSLRKEERTLPLLLTMACANDLVLGQFGQTTVLGFAVMTAGFALAATKREETADTTPPNLNVTPVENPLLTRVSYADQLRSEVVLPVKAKPIRKPRRKKVLPPE